MAGVSSTVRINDGMSPALRSMNKALNIVLSSFERMQSVSSNAIDTSDIVAARTELNNAAVAVQRVESELEQATRAQNGLTDAAKNSGSAMSGLAQKIGGAVAAYATLQTAGQTINLSDQVTQTDPRLNLIVDKKSGESVDELKAKIMSMANDSRSSYLETSKIVASFAQRAGDAFKGNDEVIAFTETLNKMYVIAGASAEEQASSMLQLTQALGSGVLRGEEFNAVFEAAPNVMQAVADYMNVPIGKLRTLAEDGVISADIVKNAMFAATDQVNKDFGSMNMTWQQVMTLFKNNAIKSLDPVLRKINSLANNKNVQNFALGVGNALSTVVTIALNAFEVMANLGEFISDNWSVIGPLIWGVVGALGTYAIYLGIIKGLEIASVVASGVMAVAKGIQAAAIWATTSATWAETTAQYGLNAAMYACPIVWIIILIVALIAALVALCNWIAETTDAANSGIGIIVGALAVAAAFIGNLFVALINAVIDVFAVLWNFIADFANFFGNVFTDPIGAIARLFFGLVDGILGLLQTLAGAIDAIFGSNLSGAVQGWRDDLSGWVDDKFGKGEEVMAKVRGEDWHVDRFEYGNAWKAGTGFGDGIAKKISDFDPFNLIGDLSKEGDKLTKEGGKIKNPSPKDVSNIANNTGSIADGVGKMADAMEITDEDIKYLRDIAEKEAVNRFTTASIKVDMNNNNTINSGMDIDGFVSQLESKIQESMERSAEGVH